MDKRVLHRMSACLAAVVVLLTAGGCDAKINMNGLPVSQSEEETKTDTSKADKNVSSVPEIETSSTVGVPEISDSSEDTSTVDSIIDTDYIDNADFSAGYEIAPVELQYLGSYDITLNDEVKAAYNYFSENYDCSIHITMTDSINEKLVEYIASGESPDLIDYSSDDFKLLIQDGLFTPLDDYIDLSAPQWTNLERYIEAYKYKGRAYYYPWEYDVSGDFLIYNRGLFNQLGINDPKELYDKGQWTWDAMTSCIMSFIDSDSSGKRTGICGDAGKLSFSFINSTGTPLISAEDGKLVNNLYDDDIESAVSYMQQLKKIKGFSSQTELYNFETTPIVDGTTAFQYTGEWMISNYAKEMKNDSSLDIFFVPFPKYPKADEYYYPMSTFGCVVPKGSANAQQAAAFINCCRWSNSGIRLEDTKKRYMKHSSLTDEMGDFIFTFKNPINFRGVIYEPYSPDADMLEAVSESITGTLFDIDNSKALSWAKMRENNNDEINKQIKSYNSFDE